MKYIIHLLIVFMMPVAVFGQHIHDSHPSTPHGKQNAWKRKTLEGPGHSTPIVKLTSSGNYMIFNEWLINSTCNENVERGNRYEKSVHHKVHVTLGGEYEWGAEAGAKLLAAEVKATTRAKVSLEGGWEGSWQEDLIFSSKVTLKPCQKMWYVFLKNKRTAEGEVEAWSHKVTCYNTNSHKEWSGYCEKKKITGTGVGWGTHLGEHVQRGLVKGCPCDNIDPNSEPVFDPSVPVPVPEPEGTSSDGIQSDGIQSGGSPQLGTDREKTQSLTSVSGNE